MSILNLNWINKLVNLVEENPLVKDFEDVETILTSLLGKENFTIKCVCLRGFQRVNKSIVILKLIYSYPSVKLMKCLWIKRLSVS